MGCIRPATPGFLVTLVATALLAVVSFCVPYFRSVYFLKANIDVDGIKGSITFGTLGYCLDLSNGTTCSSPSVGYELDINGLVGNELPIEIPNVAVKWITYALVLHLVALALAAGSALFGLLAHVREISMTCFSTCISGFAASVALIAFIFDLVLFFIARARINAVGSAEIGNAIWLTLAAWVLLFFSGCFYTIGRCCISKRAPKGDWDKRDDHVDNSYAEQMRMDAIKAEERRKAYQKQNDQKTQQGLPSFPETQPLTAIIEGDHVYVEGYKDNTASPATAYDRPGQGNKNAYSGGYVPAAPGTRAADDYYNQPPSQPAYPPNQPQAQRPPRRQPSGYAASTYAPSTYSRNPPSSHSPPPQNNSNAYLAPQPYANDRYGQEYGHAAGGSSYHTASASAHSQQPTAYSQYDNYNTPPPPEPQPQPQPYRQPTYPNYNASYAPADYNASSTPYANYYSQPTAPQSPVHDRNYTLGGTGYGANTVPPLPEQSNPYLTPQTNNQLPYPGETRAQPSAIPAPVTELPLSSSPPPLQSSSQQQSHYGHEDAPPVYDAGTSGIQGHWGKR
ncbi:hypothetical protein AX16_000283 [Volvariella volvacea WC 439]|nr:hypothetical protein AX16_000283 [Volvariella volvacea WC 439]